MLLGAVEDQVHEVGEVAPNLGVVEGDDDGGDLVLIVLEGRENTPPAVEDSVAWARVAEFVGFCAGGDVVVDKEVGVLSEWSHDDGDDDLHFADDVEEAAVGVGSVVLDGLGANYLVWADVGVVDGVRVALDGHHVVDAADRFDRCTVEAVCVDVDAEGSGLVVGAGFVVRVLVEVGIVVGRFIIVRLGGLVGVVS